MDTPIGQVTFLKIHLNNFKLKINPTFGFVHIWLKIVLKQPNISKSASFFTNVQRQEYDGWSRLNLIGQTRFWRVLLSQTNKIVISTSFML